MAVKRNYYGQAGFLTASWNTLKLKIVFYEYSYFIPKIFSRMLMHTPAKTRYVLTKTRELHTWRKLSALKRFGSA